MQVKGRSKGWALQHLLNSPTIHPPPAPPSIFVFNTAEMGIILPLLHHEDVSIPLSHTHAGRLLRCSLGVWGTNLIGAAVAYSLYGDGGDPFTLTPSPGTHRTALGEQEATAGGEVEQWWRWGCGSLEPLQTAHHGVFWRALSDVGVCARGDGGTAQSKRQTGVKLVAMFDISKMFSRGLVLDL